LYILRQLDLYRLAPLAIEKDNCTQSVSLRAIQSLL